MKNIVEPLPENMTIEEASEFWDEHSVTDYSSHVIAVEYAPEERLTLVAIAHDLLNQVAQKAQQRGVSVETLVNLWIQEKLAA